MSDDIVTRLRAPMPRSYTLNERKGGWHLPLHDAAADEIERLRAALEPFARFGDVIKHLGGSFPQTGAVFAAESHIAGAAELTRDQFDAARAALSPPETRQEDTHG